MAAFFYWYGIVCAGCLAVIVGSVLLTLTEGCIRQRLANRAAAREQRTYPAQDAALARARKRAQTRQQLDELDAIYALPSVEEPHR